MEAPAYSLSWPPGGACCSAVSVALRCLFGDARACTLGLVLRADRRIEMEIWEIFASWVAKRGTKQKKKKKSFVELGIS